MNLKRFIRVKFSKSEPDDANVLKREYHFPSKAYFHKHESGESLAGAGNKQLKKQTC